MNNKELRRIMTICFDEDRFAILKALKEHGPMTKGYLKEFLSLSTSGAAFAYHLRALSKLSIIMKHDGTVAYEITARGNRLLKMIDTFLKEKYISENSDDICMNTEDGNHVFVPVCRKCSYIKKEVKS